MSKSRAVAGWTVLLLACLAVGGAISVRLGQDRNWDLRNYHLYGPYALLEGRLHKDFYAADIQTYLNPLLDLPYYLLSTGALAEKPRTLAFLMGLPCGALAFFVLILARRVLTALQVERRLVFPLAVAAATFGVSGSACVAETGTTFNDLPIALLVVGGLLMLMPSNRPPGTIDRWAILAGGLLFGSATGLKMTAAIFVAAAPVAMLVAGGARRRSFESALLFGVGWLVAFAATWGWWGWRIYELTGNPVFPLFNRVFHSPWIDALGGLDVNGIDGRFRPTGWLQSAFYPFYWALRGPKTIAEPDFADARFALAYVAWVSLAAFALLRSRRGGAGQSNGAPLTFLLVFFGVAFAAWEAVSSILRYTVALESLSGILVAAALVEAFRRIASKPAKLLFCACALAIISATVYATVYPSWGRAKYSKRVFDVAPLALPPDSLVVFTAKPTAYVAPFVARNSPGVRFLGLFQAVVTLPDSGLSKRAAMQIASHAGPVYATVGASPQALADAATALGQFGLQFTGRPCETLTSNIGDTLDVCELRKAPGDGGTDRQRSR